LAAPLAAKASVISFHDANQGYAYYGGYDSLMYGPGKAPDAAGNNAWNGFGNYQGPATIGVFYGGGNPTQEHSQQGNPYAWYSGTTTSGPNVFAPSASPPTSGFGNSNSDGTISPITLKMSYDFDNGATGGAVQGTASFLFSHAALVTNGDVGTFELDNVPAGTYDLYLYGANYDGTRGAAFTVSSGTPLGGFTTTTNPNANGGSGPLTSYILGTDYVEFLNVTPASGVISGTWTGAFNPISLNNGEGDFNGLQLASAVPEPASIGMVAIASLAALRRRRRA
jgi:hypothetical protein